jgi:hypothetical protein
MLAIAVTGPPNGLERVQPQLTAVALSRRGGYLMAYVIVTWTTRCGMPLP